VPMRALQQNRIVILIASAVDKLVVCKVRLGQVKTLQLIFHYYFCYFGFRDLCKDFLQPVGKSSNFQVMIKNNLKNQLSFKSFR